RRINGDLRRQRRWIEREEIDSHAKRGEYLATVESEDGSRDRVHFGPRWLAADLPDGRRRRQRTPAVESGRAYGFALMVARRSLPGVRLGRRRIVQHLRRRRGLRSDAEADARGTKRKSGMVSRQPSHRISMQPHRTLGDLDDAR